MHCPRQDEDDLIEEYPLFCISGVVDNEMHAFSDHNLWRRRSTLAFVDARSLKLSSRTAGVTVLRFRWLTHFRRYNVLPFSLTSMMVTTIYLWVHYYAVQDKFKSAVLTSGLVTFVQRATICVFSTRAQSVESLVLLLKSDGRDPLQNGTPSNTATIIAVACNQTGP